MKPGLNSMQRDAPPVWEAVESYLRAIEPGTDVDDYLDELAEHIFFAPQTHQASEVCILALDRAQSILTRRSMALALALCAGSDSRQAVDALIDAYRQYNEDPYLATSILEALGILALRNPLARVETTAKLLRLELTDSRYLLIKAAKIIGWLDNAQPDTALRDKLHQLCAATDLPVQSEAYYQLGLITLGEAFLASDHAELHQRLGAAQAAFVQSEMTEELRDDATLFHILITVVTTIHALTNESSQMVQRVGRDIEQLQIKLQQINSRIWTDYRSPDTDLMALRVIAVIDALKRSVLSANTAEDWTNFDAVLIELATLHALVRSQTRVAETSSRIGAAISAIADRVIAPHLGPVMLHAVGRRRLSLVVERYRSDPTHNPDIAVSLLALEQVAILSEAASPTDVLHDRLSQLDQLTKQLNASAEEVLLNFLDAVDGNSVDRFIDQLGIAPAPLPIDRPDLYGADPTIDLAVRSLLHKLRAKLDSYPLQQWHRLVETIEALTSFVLLVRDTMPDYTLCVEDKGKGQSASERDLQDHLFEALRLKFNRSASYEHARLGGGRSDNGLRFAECFFPIEVKHEFRSIEPSTIHEHYLTQPDIYAAATDRVAFLIILDLRDINAAGHVDRAKERKRRRTAASHPSLYSLEDGFWVDTLTRDPQLPHMKPKAVVVGLVPGNRPRPSSTTTYSERPASARRKRSS